MLQGVHRYRSPGEKVGPGSPGRQPPHRTPGWDQSLGSGRRQWNHGLRALALGRALKAPPSPPPTLTIWQPWSLFSWSLSSPPHSAPHKAEPPFLLPLPSEVLAGAGENRGRDFFNSPRRALRDPPPAPEHPPPPHSPPGSPSQPGNVPQKGYMEYSRQGRRGPGGGPPFHLLSPYQAVAPQTVRGGRFYYPPGSGLQPAYPTSASLQQSETNPFLLSAQLQAPEQ